MSIRVVHLLLQTRGRCLMEKIGPNVLCHKLQLSKQKQQLSDGNGSNSKMWYYPVCVMMTMMILSMMIILFIMMAV